MKFVFLVLSTCCAIADSARAAVRHLEMDFKEEAEDPEGSELAMQICVAHRLTPGTCRVFGCDNWRGQTECINGRCVCAEGHCSKCDGSGRNGVCHDLSTWVASEAENCTRDETVLDPYLTKEVIDDSRVVLSTTEGEIVIRLRTDAAPGSSLMFANLVYSGLLTGDGCGFYRTTDWVLQSGLQGPSCRRTNPFGHFPFEYGIINTRGTVALARWEDVNSSTGEFFINVVDNYNLNRTGDSGWALGFAVFGEVESGMDVVDRLHAVPPYSGQHLIPSLDYEAQLRTSGGVPVVLPAF